MSMRARKPMEDVLENIRKDRDKMTFKQFKAVVLSDQEITLCVQNDRVIENYDPDCLTNFGYDVRAKVQKSLVRL